MTTRKGRAQLAGVRRHGFARFRPCNRPKIPGQNDLGDSARQSTTLRRSPSQSRHVLVYHATMLPLQISFRIETCVIRGAQERYAIFTGMQSYIVNGRPQDRTSDVMDTAEIRAQTPSEAAAVAELLGQSREMCLEADVNLCSLVRDKEQSRTLQIRRYSRHAAEVAGSPLRCGPIRQSSV